MTASNSVAGPKSSDRRGLAKPLGAVVALVLAAVVLRVALPGGAPSGGPGVTPTSASGSVPARRNAGAACSDVEQAFADSLRLAQREAGKSEHPWAWALVLRTLGERGSGRATASAAPRTLDPKVATSLATFARHVTPSNPTDPVLLTVDRQDGTRWVVRRPSGLWATLLSVDSRAARLIATDDKPISDEELVRTVLSQSPSPVGLSETDLAWSIDALTLAVARAPTEALAKQAARRLGTSVEWSLKELELGGRVIEPFAEKGALSAEEATQLGALRSSGAGWFRFEHAGLTLASVVIRAAEVLGERALMIRAQRLLAHTVDRPALERHLFASPAPDRGARLAALRYFTGVLEVIGTADAPQKGAQDRASKERLERVASRAAIDATAIQRAMQRDGQFEAPGASPAGDQTAYFDWLEGVLQAARGFSVAARICAP